MDFVSDLLQQYGYPILFGLGLIEFLGAPVATAPVLMVVGASAATGVINPVAAIFAVTAGALIGELTWFSVARWRGQRLINLACGLASNPNVCVVGFAQRVRRSGATLLIVAKFLPAGGSVPAIAAGIAGTGYRRFLLFDAVAVLLWGTLYVIAGALLQDEVHAVIAWASANLTPIVGSLLAVFALTLTWRVTKARRHRAMHAAHADEWPIAPD